MAKSNKQPQKPSPRTQSAAVVAHKTPVRDWLHREPLNGNSDDLLRKVFYGIAAFVLVAMFVMSLGSGINADDKYQNDYSLKLVNYYGTLGKDTSAYFVKDGNMHLYGGLFEIITGFVNKAAGLAPTDLAYHNVRHAASAIFGWFAIVFAALLARYIAGWRAGIIILIIMALSPRFVGDSLMNPKDIPFACGYMMALYFLAKVLDTLPRPSKWDMAGLVGGLGIALAIRAGGLLPFAYLFMFAGLHFLLKNGGFRALGNTKSMGRYLMYVIGLGIAGYALAVLFWPYALHNPMKNPLKALSQFSALEVRIRVLYDGMNLKSDATPWHYPLKWIGYTIPLAVIAGLAGYILLLPKLLKRYQPLWIIMVLFAGIFPVFYIIYKHSVIHDGWRHITFAYPPLAICAGLCWNELVQLFTGKKMLQYAVYGAFGLMIADAAWFIGANPAMPYVYFNPLIGGTKGAFGKYETDYWGVSVRQGIEWMEKQGILGPNMKDQVVIATNMFYSAQKLTAKYGDKVKIKYLRWELRCDDVWDYALYPSRFMDGSTLRHGNWPGSNAIHTITAGGAPILAILKDTGHNCGQGMAALRKSEWNNAIQFLSAETSNVPDNDLAWTNLGQAYLGRGRALAQQDTLLAAKDLDAAKAAAEKAITFAPDDSAPNNLIALYWLEKGDLIKARTQFELAAKRDPSNVGAFYYLALFDYNDKNADGAMANLQKVITISPTYKPAYEMAARIYEDQGNKAQAQRMRTIISQLK
jgi:hypothetical protein